MVEITAVEISKNPVQTGEEFKLSVTIKETTDYPFDFPYDYPIAHVGDGH